MSIKSPDEKAKISVNIPGKLLNELDLIRKENKQDRSSWITSAIMEKLALIKREKEEENK
tara:strand:- start:509 stop:688 length:180 start_codon:yes stop_codon:yes gene_type:complete